MYIFRVSRSIFIKSVCDIFNARAHIPMSARNSVMGVTMLTQTVSISPQVTVCYYLDFSSNSSDSFLFLSHCFFSAPNHLPLHLFAIIHLFLSSLLLLHSFLFRVSHSSFASLFIVSFVFLSVFLLPFPLHFLYICSFTSVIHFVSFTSFFIFISLHRIDFFQLYFLQFFFNNLPVFPSFAFSFFLTLSLSVFLVLYQLFFSLFPFIFLHHLNDRLIFLLFLLFYFLLHSSPFFFINTLLRYSFHLFLPFSAFFSSLNYLVLHSEAKHFNCHLLSVNFTHSRPHNFLASSYSLSNLLSVQVLHFTRYSFFSASFLFIIKSVMMSR